MSKEINISGFRVALVIMAGAWFYQSTLEQPSKESLIMCFMFLILAVLHRIEEKLDKLNSQE